MVFDGPPGDLTAEVLTTIYGEEDWTAAADRKRGAAGDADDEPALDEERMAGIV
jgi:phosphonate transport system ATP-binding protein